MSTDWAKVLTYGAGSWRFTEGRGDDDGVTFITLDVLKVLDEQGLPLCRPMVPVGVCATNRFQPLFQQFSNQVSLLDVQCDDAKRLVGASCNVLNDCVHDTLGFAQIGLVFVNGVGKIDGAHTELAALSIRRGEDHQVATVEAVV